MKQILSTAVLCVLFASCTDSVSEEKKLYKDVTSLHTKAMAANKTMLQNRAPIESLLNQNLQAATKDSALIVNRSIVSADDAMAGWMKKLKTIDTAKFTGENVDVLTDQKQQIITIDSLTRAATVAATAFLAKHKN